MLCAVCSVIYCCVRLDIIKMTFGLNIVIPEQSPVGGELTDCNALVTLGIFVSHRFVTPILISSSGARFNNILNPI